jgi:hypothetical protein
MVAAVVHKRMATGIAGGEWWVQQGAHGRHPPSVAMSLLDCASENDKDTN